MTTDLTDHVAVVTGATSGIGAAVAARLAGCGSRVVLAGRRREEGERVAARIGPRALDLAAWDRLMAVNLRAPLVAARRAAPVMIATGGGSIVNVASVSGHRAGYSGHDYSTAKAGLLHLTRSLAVELGAHGVRVNSVSPGPVATEIFGGSGDDAPPFAALLPRNQPIPRPGTVDDVAAAVAFLAAPASAFVTGQDLAVDGGITAGRPWSVMCSDRAAITEAVTAGA